MNNLEQLNAVVLANEVFKDSRDLTKEEADILEQVFLDSLLSTSIIEGMK